MSPDRVRAGYKRCVESFRDWPPTLAEFEDACRLHPEDVGCPDSDAAWKNACYKAYPYSEGGKWLHKCVWFAACNTGLLDIHEKGERMRKEFDKQYQSAIQQLDSIQEPPVATLPKKQTEEDRRRADVAAEAALCQLREMFG